MAKINHHNFVDTINDILSEAKKRGVIHLEFEGDDWKGDTLKIQNRDFVNFGTCGYMGLETHPKVIDFSLDFTRRYGTQFSVSRSYLVSKQNCILEDYLSEIFLKKPVIAFTSTTIAHMSVLPIMVGYQDAIILDQQAHISIQTAAQQMAPKGVPIDIIRHSNLEMLEHKIKSVYDKYDKIWYMIDGVYSMYGDLAPIDEINQLMEKYEKLHLYVDDAHGMSWYGKNGCGRLYAKCAQNNKTMYITTLAKGFGTMGGIAVFPNITWYDKLILHGGPLSYSHPLPPPMLGAAIGSAQLHLSPEINEIQQSLKEKLDYANMLFEQIDIPILSNPETPIYFVGTGQPTVGYNLNKRIIDEGFYVNIGMFPAVPVKNTGLRFTITNHNSKAQIKSFIDALAYHYPLVMQEENKTVNEVRKAFRLPVIEKDKKPKRETENDFIIVTTNTIQEIDKGVWDSYMAEMSICDWNNMLLIEKSFCNNLKPEDNWEFYYYLVKERETNEVLLCTFFTSGIYKDDLLTRYDVSKKIEALRAESPYYLTSKTLSMGSLITEGDHIFINRNKKSWKQAFLKMLDFATQIQEKKNINTLILRDFDSDDNAVSDLLYENGFAKINMPNSNQIENLDISSTETFLSSLSKNGRSNIRRYVIKNEPIFDIEFKPFLSESEIHAFHHLHEQVKRNNFAVNIFSYPIKFFEQKNKINNWEFIVLKLKHSGEIISFGSCYKAKLAYCPVVIGIDYNFNSEYKIYKQMLYQAVKRGFELGYNKINLGLTADADKKDVGAKQKQKIAFFQSTDNYNYELIENMPV